MRRYGLLALLLLAMPLVACGDDDGGTNTNCTDGDGDGYGVGADCLGADCDDADPAVWATGDAYPDADGDGHFATEAETVCYDGSNIPATYSSQPGDDCDDSDAQVWQEMQGYIDADGDGVAAATAVAETLCTDGNLPAGYSDAAGSDCDDTDAAVYEEVSGYADLDQDGVYGADATSMVTACTDGSLPPGTQADPGTDCDDFDPFAQSNEPTCQFLGICVDTEAMGNPSLPDLRGIGACQSTDCDGSNPAAWEPMFEMTSPPTCSADDECGTGNSCIDGTCWMRNPECNTGSMTCSAFLACLQQCRDNNPPGSAQAAVCMQHDCYEQATPKAQLLYMFAQQCAAQAGCFASPDVQGCALTYCTNEFVACTSDQ